VDQLHRTVDLLQQVQPVPVAQAPDGDLHDRKGHLREVEELLVAVDADAEVDLRDPVEAEVLEDVDQVPDLDAVAGEEGQPLQHLAAPGVLAGERLQES